MRFEYWKTADGAWAWELKSSIGDVLARGMPQSSRESCLTTIKIVKLAASAGCRELPVPPTRDAAAVDAPPPVRQELVFG